LSSAPAAARHFGRLILDLGRIATRQTRLWRARKDAGHVGKVEDRSVIAQMRAAAKCGTVTT
jgi:hypothetical protein